MSSPEYKYDLFISYAVPDSAWVEGYLLDALTVAGVSLIHEKVFELGAPRLSEFERAVKESRRVLLVISHAYMSDEAKGFVDLLSQQYGIDTGTWPVIPLLREPVRLPARLSMLVSLQATNSQEADAALGRLLADLARTSAPVMQPACPYPGMRPFRSDEAGFFFGRSSEIEGLRLRLRAEPLMLVVGPSGSGKSSLVMAGLIPKLEDEGWATVNLRPGADPQTRLREALTGIVNLESGMRIDGKNTPLLIIVDQLEEIFTLTTDVTKRNAFIAELLQLTAIANLKTVQTMRADFFGDLMESDPLWSVVEQRRQEIKTLNAEDLRKAIVEPATQVTVYVEPALVERLVADADGEPGMLPFVQETLRLLWEKLERRFLPLRAYEALVLTHKSYVSTGENGLLVAMGVHADAAFNALKTDEHKGLARRTFLRLIQFGEGRENTRRQQRQQDLLAVGDNQAEFAQVLTHLADHRLLTTSDEDQTGERKVDLAHEALIKGWPALRKWIDERRDQEQARRRLETKAAEWIQLGRQQGGRLDETELPEAKRWLTSEDAIELGASEDLLSLVSYSENVLLTEAAAQEVRRLHALTQQRTLNQRLYMVLGLISVVLIGMVISVWLVNRERVRANDNARIARVGELVAQAQAVQQQENLLPLGMLLALEAYRAEATDGAEEILRQGLTILPEVVASTQHTSLVEKVAFSIDGKWMASAGDDGSVHIIDVATNTQIKELEHTSAVHTLMFRSDGLQLATGTDDGTIKLWSVPALAPEGTLEHRGGVFHLTYAQNSEWLASAGFDGEAYIWELKSQAELFRIHHKARINHVAAYDSRLVATASDDGTAQIWDVTTKTEILHFQHPGWLLQTIFSPDGTQVATAGNDATVRIWDLKTGKQLFLLQHDEALESIAFSPNGKLLATASDDDMARIWDPTTGREIMRLFHEGNVFYVTFDPTGRLLATASDDGTARVWDVAAGQEIARMTHDAIVSHVVFNGGKLQVATAGQDKVARVWQLPVPAHRVIRHQSLIGDADFSPDGMQVATASEDETTFTAWLWDIATGNELTHLPDYGIWVRAIAFSPNGRELAVGVHDGRTQIWDLTTGSKRLDLLEAEAVTALTYAANGDELAIANRDGEIRLWSLATQQSTLATVYKAWINDLVYTPGGDGILSVDEGGFVRLWNFANRNEALTRSHDGSPLFAVAVSPDGDRFATAGADRTARIWDITSGEELARLVHQDEVHSVAWSTDGRWLVTGSADHLARIWDTETGEELVRLLHRDPVTVVKFDQTGQWLLTVSNNVAMIWDVTKLQPIYTNDLIDAVCRRLPHNLSSSEWERYFPGEEYRQTCPKLRAGPGINDLPDQ